MENEKEAFAISDYLHSLDVTQPLAYYMARGLSVELAKVVVAAQRSAPRTFRPGVICPMCEQEGHYGDECPNI